MTDNAKIVREWAAHPYGWATWLRKEKQDEALAALAALEQELAEAKAGLRQAAINDRALTDYFADASRRAEAAEAELVTSKSVYASEHKLRTSIQKVYLETVAERDTLRDELAQTERDWADLREALDAGTKALNGFLWLDNNRHNYGSAAWLDYFNAAADDARAALAGNDT